MKIRLKTSIKTWTHGGRTYRDLNPGDVVEMPEEDARILLNANLAELAESGGGSMPSTTSSLNQGREEDLQGLLGRHKVLPPAAPGREGGAEVAPQSVGGPVAAQAGGEPPSPAKPEAEPADPRLLTWLNQHGFRQLSNKPVYVKHDKIGGRIVRLVVDFKDNPWGNRYAYTLNEETGQWEDSREFRDSEELLAYKQFRDELRRGTQVSVRVASRPKEVEVAPGIVALQNEQQLYVMVEQRDEEQVMRELLGEVLRQYIYRFEVGGRVVTNISYAGVKEAARRRGNIHVTRVEVDETKDGRAVIAKAEVYDLQNNFKIWGVAVQPKMMRLRDGSEVEDQFCVQKAVSKAIRNGLRACIPEKLIAELVSKWLEEYGREAGG
jgi:hypothetical protein